MNPLNILVTSWGTDITLDDVRTLTNFSGGTTGAIIAESVLKAGHIVNYIYSEGRKRPFLHKISSSLKNMNGEINIPEEIWKFKWYMNEYNIYSKHLTETVVSDFYDYKRQVLKLIEWQEIDVVVLAMAVSDYWLKKTKWKIPSTQETMTLELEKLPKIISYIKTQRPDICLVWFKLLTADTSEQELLNVAKEALVKNNQDIIVANLLEPLSKSILKTHIITKNWEDIAVLKRNNLPWELIKAIEKSIKDKSLK